MGNMDKQEGESMARPQKEGLDYFSFDTDMDQDDKILLIEARHNITGFAVLVKLLMKIYREGYFYKWSEREQLLLSNRINVDINTVVEVVNDCIKWEFFNNCLYKKYGILTSGGIQKRYFEAIKRRKEVVLIAEYLVIDPPESNEKLTVVIVNVDKNPSNADINYVGEELLPTLVHKVKETKVNDISIVHFDEFWKLYPKKIGKTSAVKCWKTLINNKASYEDLISASSNYATAVNGKEQQYILQASTFLGPQKRFEDYIKGAPGNGGNSGRDYSKVKT